MLEAGNNNELPAIPGKRYFTIGEVSELCGVKAHVLRYWE
ncbi:MAG TPA: MerR family DNA-binding transcriptional regulator, partial [Gammaproteobacteria bacterium]|nr:MerR family DNA-binding transcriptional regulator [Gammaproteobacteria bacterium]